MLPSAKLEKSSTNSVIFFIFSLRDKEGTYGEKKHKNCEENSKITLIFFLLDYDRPITFDRTKSLGTARE